MGHVTITTPLLVVIFIYLVKLDIVYQYTKFDSSSLSCSLDMDGVQNLKWVT